MQDALPLIRALSQALNDVTATLTLDAGWSRDCDAVARAEAVQAEAEAVLRAHEGGPAPAADGSLEQLVSQLFSLSWSRNYDEGARRNALDAAALLTYYNEQEKLQKSG
ncbi:hypothetical protein GURKE_04970 [Brevundimonas phage vB_BpoS-Gurke]|uniref:Uncharacterized protein n=1 Tax=Brevundimonas phage vB_BpoS-Gurke TaxID=2948599 RepID=A0A9E7N530_9CAUD|nr:hypothetical protein GURKE_04970 [Brevundimonas phage vB_BpoS-Gurke]